jgi:aqualysin 1
MRRPTTLCAHDTRAACVITFLKISRSLLKQRNFSAKCFSEPAISTAQSRRTRANAVLLSQCDACGRHLPAGNASYFSQLMNRRDSVKKGNKLMFSSINLKRFSIVLLASLTLYFASLAPTLVRGQEQKSEKAEKGKLLKHENAIPNSYIVVLKDEAAGLENEQSSAPELSIKLTAAYGGRAERVYKHALRGFALTATESQALALSQDPRVEFVEEDLPTYPAQEEEEEQALPGATQPSPPWGLDRIDQRDSRDNVYTYNAAGAGVNVYVIDSGIRASHRDFGGRVVSAYSAINDGYGTGDCLGHGTHVAGTIGGNTYGVAKLARLHSVRVFGCNGGTVATMIAGIDWVSAYHQKPAVANLSGSAVDANRRGAASPALDQAVRNLIARGVTFVAAAMNDNQDAANVSPARVSEALTVGAVDINSAKATFSNYGSVVDLFAPGVGILSTGHRSDTEAREDQGTSMAAPHVAGVAALYLQNNPGAAPATVASAIINGATTGRLIGNLGAGSPNRLLYSLIGGGNNTGNTAPCSQCTPFSGALAGTGYQQQQPNGGWYYSAYPGSHNGWLRVPAGANFDLYLFQWDVYKGWVEVARAQDNQTMKQISFPGAPGYYTWLIHSRGGGGSYNFWLQRPQ